MCRREARYLSPHVDDSSLIVMMAAGAQMHTGGLLRGCLHAVQREGIVSAHTADALSTYPPETVRAVYEAVEPEFKFFREFLKGDPGWNEAPPGTSRREE